MSIESMSDEKLLATLVGQEGARRMLARSQGNLLTVVREAQRPYVVQGRNTLPPNPIGAAIELVKRAYVTQMEQRSCFESPGAVRDYLRIQTRDLQYEVFIVLFLDARHRLIAAEEMFRGTLTQTSVYPREVVKRALHHNASAVILSHNHPSGSAEPSTADEMLTRTLKETLALVEVRVLDHMIVAGSDVLSFAERGLI